MKIRRLGNRMDQSAEKMEYPVASMGVCLLLIYLSPFLSLTLNYLAFAVCLYRVIRYDEAVFAVDYCVLAGVSYIFLTASRVSLFAWLSIVVAIWFIVKDGVKANTALVLLILLFDYMLLRMNHAVNNFVLCFSQLLLLYVLLSTQKRAGIAPCALAFCESVIVSSAYALIFRSTPQMRSLLGDEAAAYWGSSLKRFQGLFRDPNYYMTMVTIAIALLAVLWINQYVSRRVFLCGICPLIGFGAITYSKTFIIVLVILTAIFVAMLFHKKRYLSAIGSILLVTAAMLVFSQTLFSVTLYRITSTKNLYDLTTGRNELLINYAREIGKSARSLFFGEGLSADLLTRGTHNLFLEIVYFLGVIGLFLLGAYFISLLSLVERKFEATEVNSNGVFKYAVLIAFLLLFCTLQGMTFPITYVMLYLSILATEIRPQIENL